MCVDKATTMCVGMARTAGTVAKEHVQGSVQLPYVPARVPLLCFTQPPVPATAATCCNSSRLLVVVVVMVNMVIVEAILILLEMLSQ
mmetsp:Transcript_10709/g.29367  ORF Transcript_10709/g.29367 Transcript_10709/m.29367 type:complete len:87 (-) Transcript_10709:133-393(-)